MCIRDRLLERAAEELAEALLLEWDRIEKISIEIKKPWAPVRLPLKTVSVKIERGWHTAYTVSYTHLDVYKRQPLRSAITHAL